MLQKKQASVLMNEQSLGNSFIRVGVKGGGCSGLSYELSFDNILKDGDEIFEDNGIKIICDKKSLLYLELN